MHLDRGSVGCFAHPCVQVFPFACLEEEDVVAVVEVCQLVELVEFCFRVEFGIFSAVREERVEVVDEVSVSGKSVLDQIHSSMQFERFVSPICHTS